MYAYETLKSHVVPYVSAIDNSFLLMQDNVRRHAARLVENFLEPETVQRMR